MNVRWTAVLTGFLVDFLISSLISLTLRSETFSTAPDFTNPQHIVLIILLTLSTGIGGYVAGRIAGIDRVLNGFLVSIVGILVGQLGGVALPQPLVLASAAACLVAALGGYLSRFPRQPSGPPSLRPPEGR
jgi:putative membrane protein (TIGR04086 family)